MIFMAKGHQDEILEHFAPGALEEIEGILGVTSDDVRASVRVDLAFAMSRRVNPHGSGLASDAAVRRHVEAISKAARQLRDAIAPLLLDGDEDADTARITFMAIADVDFDIVFEVFEATKAMSSVNVPKSKGGRRPNVDDAVLMLRLAEIYETYTRKKPAVTWDAIGGRYSGHPFFRMAELVDQATATATEAEPMTNSALGELLHNVARSGRKKGIKPALK
jgi:hypothetical protein